MPLGACARTIESTQVGVRTAREEPTACRKRRARGARNAPRPRASCSVGRLKRNVPCRHMQVVVLRNGWGTSDTKQPGPFPQPVLQNAQARDVMYHVWPGATTAYPAGFETAGRHADQHGQQRARRPHQWVAGSRHRAPVAPRHVPRPRQPSRPLSRPPHVLGIACRARPLLLVARLIPPAPSRA